MYDKCIKLKTNKLRGADNIESVTFTSSLKAIVI